MTIFFYFTRKGWFYVTIQQSNHFKRLPPLQCECGLERLSFYVLLNMYTFCLNLFGMQGLIWMRFKMRFSNELYFSERLDKKLLTSSWQIWIFFMNVRNFWDFVQFLWPSYKVRTLLTYQQYNVNVEWLSIKFNISSVVEFQRWWVLKSKIFAMWWPGFKDYIWFFEM